MRFHIIEFEMQQLIYNGWVQSSENLNIPKQWKNLEQSKSQGLSFPSSTSTAIIISIGLIILITHYYKLTKTSQGRYIKHNPLMTLVHIQSVTQANANEDV